MFCKNCGAELREGASFCGKCGTPAGQYASSSNGESQEPVIDFSEMGKKAKAVAGKGMNGVKNAATAIDTKVSEMSQAHTEKKKAQEEERARMMAMAPNPYNQNQQGYEQNVNAGQQTGTAGGAVPPQGYQNVPPQGAFPPGYGFAPIKDYDPRFDYKPIGMWGYFGWNILFTVLLYIPVIGWLVNFIVLLILSLKSSGNINLRNYARSFFCVTIIVAVVATIVLVVVVGGVSRIFR